MALDPSILEQIRTNDPDLTLLNLSLQNIDDNDAIILAAALKSNRTLTQLYLSNNAIGEAGATALAGALKNNHTLAELDLNYNFIGNAGITALAGALRNNCTLTELRLCRNNIDKAGAIALAGALKANGTLTILDFWDNAIGAAGANTLTDALITSKNIVYIVPATEELIAHSEQNNATAKALIERIRIDPGGLTRDERQEIQERIPAILYVSENYLNLSKEQTLKMLASIGIKPTPGPATQRINAVREAQRKAALEDPSQGI